MSRSAHGNGQAIAPALPPSEAPQPDRLMTTRDLCRFLGVSMRWVHERTRRGEIPCYRLGSILRFDPQEIRAWITQYRRGERL